MRIIVTQRSQGIALMVVMIAIFVMTILVGAFAYAMKVEMKLALNANREEEMIWQGRSGVEFAKWVLALHVQTCRTDTETQKWANGPGDDCETNGPLADVSLVPARVGEITFPYSVWIRDLDRKININTVNANEIVMRDALTLVGVDGGEIPSIMGAIQDWIDPDDNTRINGAESDDYQSFNPPYHAKNRPIDDLQDLLLIRGITPEMYWGGVATNYGRAAFQRRNRLGRQMPQPVFTTGLRDIFTPMSGGRVNIHTAPESVVTVLLGGDANAAAALMQFRKAPGGSQMGVNELLRSATAGLPNQAIAGLSQLFTERSTTFEVEVEANVAGEKRRFFAIVRRDGRTVQTLSFYWH